MTFRSFLAAAAAATVLVACGEAPGQKSTTPATQDLPSGTLEPRTLGHYELTIAPVPGNDRLYGVTLAPDATNGNPNTNPPGTVQIAGQFTAAVAPNGTTVDANTGATVTNTCGVDAIYASVKLTNFNPDSLQGAWANLITAPDLGNEPCNALPPGSFLGQPAGGYTWAFTPTAIAGSSVADGTVAGGSATSGWWIKLGTRSSKVVKLDVFVDPKQPIQTANNAWLETGGTVTFTTAATGLTGARVELCQSSALVAPEPCSGQTTIAATLNGANGSATVSGLVSGTQYFWRARNLFTAGNPGTFASNWIKVTGATPPTFLGPIPGLRTRTANTVTPWTYTWRTGTTAVPETYFKLCDTINDALCAAPVAQGNVAPIAFGQPNYSLDLTTVLADPVTANFWLLPGSYALRLYNVAAGQLPAAAAVSPAPLPASVSTVVPLATGLTKVGPLISWSFDTNVTTTDLELCTNDTTAGHCSVTTATACSSTVACPGVETCVPTTNVCNVVPVVSPGTGAVHYTVVGDLSGAYSQSIATDQFGRAVTLANGRYYYRVFATDFFTNPILTNSVTGTFTVP